MNHTEPVYKYPYVDDMYVYFLKSITHIITRAYSRSLIHVNVVYHKN